MNKIEQAQFDSVLKQSGRKAANLWAALNVTLYDVWEAPREPKQDPLTVPSKGAALFRATMQTVARFLDMHPDAVKRVLADLDKCGASFIYHSRGRMANLFHAIKIAEGGTLPAGSGEYELHTDLKRLHEASYVSVQYQSDDDVTKTFAFDGRLMSIALDVGPHVWVHASYADTLPEGAVQVGDGRSPGYSQDGQRIVSVPAAWCTFYTDEEANAIEQLEHADRKMGVYA